MNFNDTKLFLKPGAAVYSPNIVPVYYEIFGVHFDIENSR